LENNIILNAQRGNEWASYDVSRFGITIPEEGLFVAMEWLPESAKQIYHLGFLEDGREVFANGQRLGANPVKRTEANEGMVAVIRNYPSLRWIFYGRSSPTILVPLIKVDIIEKK
jgi:hypothetical protein